MAKTTRRRFIILQLFGLVSFVAAACQSTTAADGNNPLNLSTFNGWSAFELITQGDDISAISDSGYGNTAARGNYDGLGAYVTGNQVSIFINHEAANSAISRLDLDLANLHAAIASTISGGATPFPSSIATGMGYAYNSIHDGSYHAVTNSIAVATGTSAVGTYGDANFARFCSGTSHLANSFGSGRGFVDQLYLTGEEVSSGQFYALDSANGVLWQAPDLGLGRWENAALVDTGNSSHVALVINSDNGTAPGDYVQMYVGKKGVDVNGDGTIDFLERNGLRGGTVYYFDPDGAASTTDLPDGQVTGTWTTSTTNALRETKLEDVHTNPNNGSQLVLTDQTDGVYIVDLSLQFASGVFDAAGSTTSFTQIDDDDVGDIGAPDNVVWTANDLLYVQEDGSNNDMWQMNPDGTGLLKIAHGFSEPSGIFDISGWIGYQPGSVFLTSIQGAGNSGAQLAALVSPNATILVPEPTAIPLLIAGLLAGLTSIRRRR